MSKELFTPGEWIAMNRTGTGIYKIVSDTLQEICETQIPYDESISRQQVFEQGKANAKLISASKDMYYALKSMVETFEKDFPTLATSGLDKNIEASKKALSKATGQQ